MQQKVKPLVFRKDESEAAKKCPLGRLRWPAAIAAYVGFGLLVESAMPTIRQEIPLREGASADLSGLSYTITRITEETVSLHGSRRSISFDDPGSDFDIEVSRRASFVGWHRKITTDSPVGFLTFCSGRKCNP
ncbi:hypothetical protein HZC07_01330 [Candidatus Micrarchaeota archaeon]|nr:hypothetical protein [Candidatus Micrarchaeota archaeon]